MLLLVGFAFFLAFLVALRIGRRVALLELADLDGDLVAFHTQTDGQFGVASLDLGRGVQGLVGVIGTEGGAHFVAFGLFGQTVLLAAFELAFEVIAASRSFQSGNVAIAVARILIDRNTVLERELFQRRRRGRALGRG